MARTADLMTTGPTAGSADFNEEGFDRLPKGEPVAIMLRPNEALPVVLADHKCHLVMDGGLALLDTSGQRRALGAGRNIVGRDQQCDVVIDRDFKNVSRKHLLIETDGESLVRLTDISSLGTWVPCECLAAGEARARA